MIGANEKRKIIHQPKLDTIRMVEKFIEEHSGEFKKRALWEHLPKKMMYQTFCVIIDYLVESGKIAMDREGTIGWIWDPEMVKKYKADDSLRIR
jgi:hypothetical protein